jgi:hypothetical protein
MHAAVADLGGEAVAGGGEQARARFVFRQVVLLVVDEPLRVFDAEADGEGFGFEQDVAAGEELIDITRGVAGGEDHGIGGDFTAGGGDDSADVFILI